MYNKISQFCEIKGIKVAHLCEKLGIKPSVLSNLKKHSETRDASLSAENAAKIADYMGISVTELIGGYDNAKE